MCVGGGGGVESRKMRRVCESESFCHVLNDVPGVTRLPQVIVSCEAA